MTITRQNKRHSAPATMQREKIWDPVSRLWHWVFALAIVVNWLLGRFMTFDTVRWHFYMGIFILALLLFRLLWGLFGPQPVRFKSFWPTPSRLFRYMRGFLRREPSGAPGHNPLGALSVYALLLVAAAQGITGLFIEAEDFFEAAPLHGYVSERIADFMSSWHHVMPVVILVLVALHVAAILFYWIWKRENLLKPMITGWKWVKQGQADE